MSWSAPRPLPLPLHTERLLIRPFVVADARALHEAVAGSRDLLWPWLEWAQMGHRTVEESAAIIETFGRLAAKPDSLLCVWGLFDRQSGGLLGGTGLNAFDARAHSADVGYWLRREAQGHGYVTEATRAVIQAALSPAKAGGWGLRRVGLRCAAANEASARVARRLGLRLELRGVEDRYQRGLGFHDTLAFAVLRREWDFERGCGPVDARTHGLEGG